MMRDLRSIALLAVRLSAGLVLGTSAAKAASVAERNIWPVKVTQYDESGAVTSWQAAGPLIYKKATADNEVVSGFRPLYAQWRSAAGDLREVNVLYPVFTYRTDGFYYRWSVLQMILRSGDRAGRASDKLPALADETFDIWPFWFSRTTSSPETTYWALFPVYGITKNRFWHDQLNWVLFPLYGRAKRNEAVTIASPWPIIATTYGAEQGFRIWPLFGWRTRPASFERRFFLWPLGWNNALYPAADAPPNTAARRQVGFLPFYTRETAQGLKDENYLWPFFGYTRREEPFRYNENRYFWPFIVRGRGDERIVDRFGPFYTHSVVKGMDKRWVMWPLYREKRFSDAGIAQRQRQVLYFLYWSLEQRSLTNPSAAPAEKSHLWPLYSKWDNGAGRKQLQFPSPLELFFQGNERIRESWSPLFSLYRFDQREPGTLRHEAFWGLFSWTRSPSRREFHLGPIVSMEATGEGKRFAVGNGLIGMRRSANGGWRAFWFEFSPKAQQGSRLSSLK
jgi:hypothetical protein